MHHCDVGPADNFWSTSTHKPKWLIIFVDGVDSSVRPSVKYALTKELNNFSSLWFGWCLDLDHCTTQVLSFLSQDGKKTRDRMTERSILIREPQRDRKLKRPIYIFQEVFFSVEKRRKDRSYQWSIRPTHSPGRQWRFVSFDFKNWGSTYVLA